MKPGLRGPPPYLLSTPMSMEAFHEAWTPVPQFGGWDTKSGSPNYSMVFSQARANRKHYTPAPKLGGWDTNSQSPNYSMVFPQARHHRKQHKSVFDRPNFDNEHTLIRHHPRYHSNEDDIPMRRRRLLSCFSCCIRV